MALPEDSGKKASLIVSVGASQYVFLPSTPPKVTVTCKTEDHREEIAQKEKTFALVLTGTGETELPEDAQRIAETRIYKPSAK